VATLGGVGGGASGWRGTGMGGGPSVAVICGGRCRVCGGGADVGPSADVRRTPSWWACAAAACTRRIASCTARSSWWAASCKMDVTELLAFCDSARRLEWP
jgi:hypothetical protein